MNYPLQNMFCRIAEQFGIDRDLHIVGTDPKLLKDSEVSERAGWPCSCILETLTNKMQ